MEILTSIATKIAEFTVAPVGRQFGYVIFYNRNVDNLKRKLQELQGTKAALQHSIEAAERNGEEIEANVKHWLDEVDDTIAEASSFHNNEGYARVGCSNGSIPNLWMRHQLSRKAKKMAQGISEKIPLGKFERISFRPRLPVTVPASAREYEALQSRTSILNDIMKAFKDANMYKIGVYGTGGVGKSTLVRELAWQAERDKTFGFSAVVLTSVTNSPDVKKIQSEISYVLGLKFDTDTQVGRAAQLRERIKKEKRILVILDDIWRKLDLTEVGVPFGDEYRGCKLLLTSRDLNVLNSEMGIQKDFKLEVLSQEESWSLFEKTVGYTVKDTNLTHTATQIANRCVGLPLLIVTVAAALKNKDSSIWKDTLKTLAKVDREGLGSQIYSGVELSYNHLESDELKSFFLFIGSFGNGLSTMDLVIYGWGLGFYKDVDTLADARNRVYRLINDLRASCLLLDGERDWIKMHDVIHGVASSIASKVEPFFAVQRNDELKTWPEMDLLQRCHRILLPQCYIKELPEHLECPKLKILVLNSKKNYLKVPDNFLEGMGELKVLDLGGLNFCPSLPLSLSHLTTLRALYLCECMLEDISVVAKLTSLEILSLDRSEIKELPVELEQLTHLRLLNLSDCIGLRVIPTNFISRFTCMEELYMGNCFFQWESEGSNKETNNASLGELRHLRCLNTLNLQIQDSSVLPRDLPVFRTLEYYKILIGDGWKWTWCSYRHYETTRTLKLNQGTRINIHLDDGIRSLLNTVEELYLANLKGVKNVLSQLNREGFLQLKFLDIQNSAEIQYIVDSTEWIDSSKVFPNLETLILQNLSGMKQMCRGPLSIQSFANLKVIKVGGCDELKNLFSYSLIKNLSQILEIEISKCKSMTEVIVDSRFEKDEVEQIIFPQLYSLTLKCLPVLVSFCSMPLKADMEYKSCVSESKDEQYAPLAIIDEKVAFPNLKSMKLSLNNTQKIWDEKVLTQSGIQNLTNLTIDSCGSIKYLFPSSVAKELANLNYLEISNCQTMEEIYVLEGELPSVPLSREEAIFPNLEALVVSHMDNLNSVWHNDLPPNSFCNVKKVEIKFCNKLQCVFPSHLLNIFQNVETMIITNCDALEVLFETMRMNSSGGNQSRQVIQLRTLILKDLPMLSYVFPFSVATDLLQLQVLDVRDCGVENIVAKDEMAKAAPTLRFPQLTSLTLRRLINLRSFYPGIHILDCPILRELDVCHCDKLQLFTSESLSCPEDIPVERQHIISFEKVFPTPTEVLTLNSKDVKVISESQYDDDNLYNVKCLNLTCFHNESEKLPWGFIQKFANLEELAVQCSSFVEIFSSESLDNDYTQVIMKLRNLRFHGLQNLKYMCGEDSAMQPILQNLEYLQVCCSDSLKSIVSSSVVFQNLNTLRVYRCKELVTVITSSTARSLVNLRTLIIHDCKMTEEIVACEDDDAGEITLMKLESLELVDLSRLARFCKGNYNFKFPLLEVLFVIGCPMMETFSRGFISAPSLRRVRVEPQAGGEWCWEGDLNTTITTIFNKRHPMLE